MKLLTFCYYGNNIGGSRVRLPPPPPMISTTYVVLTRYFPQTFPKVHVGENTAFDFLEYDSRLTQPSWLLFPPCSNKQNRDRNIPKFSVCPFEVFDLFSINLVNHLFGGMTHQEGKPVLVDADSHVCRRTYGCIFWVGLEIQ